MFIRLPSRLHMPSVSLPLYNTLLLSLLASVFLLAVIRAALLFLRARSSEKLVQQKQQSSSSHSESSPSSSSSWSLLALFRWDNLPTLPLSLKLNEDEMKGRGVGFAPPQHLQPQPWHSARRSGPAFESPLPAMYQSDVPVSMAKMIMSRHTFRKPTQRPPPKPAKNGLQMQYTRRSASMV